MRKFWAYFVGFALGSVPIAVTAQESDWLPVGTSPTGTVWSLRTKDAANSTNYNPTVWIQRDHSNDRTVTHRKTLAFVNFDCKGKRSKTLSVIEYNANGSVVSSHDFTYPTYSYAPPDSMIEGVMEWACPVDE